jgi:nitrous oxidase accessory protein NosD
VNRKFSIKLLALIATVIFLSPTLLYTVQSAPPIPEQIITVDITGNGDYVSIQDAIDHATPTNIIKIKSGVYQEHTISINKKIQLIGDDVNSTIINCSGNLGITIDSSYVDIANIQIINTLDYAISIQPTSNGCTISFCDIFEITKGNGIDIMSSYNTISHCNFYGTEQSGQGIKISGSYNTVDGCTLQHLTNGVLILLGSNNNKVVNCNIFDNENAVDIRLNSNSNLITNCNVYSNLQGIKIWQNSNDNSVYLNNIFKNDNNAIDEKTNNWDNGKQGNYWDNYQGTDQNNDGIGDTPYLISGQSQDNFPLMASLLPDVVTAPDNLRFTTSASDQTPAFAWNPVLYSKGTKGYYVKIDNGLETFIGDTTTWTSPDEVSNGTHIFYVRAVGVDDVSSEYATITFSIDTSLADSDNDGLTDVEETKLGSNPNDKSDVMKIYLGGKLYYLVDINQDGSFDVLYNQITKTRTVLETKGVNYLIDQNGDGTWDYVYNTMDGSISLYKEETPIYIWIILTLVVIAIISTIALYYFRNIRTKLKYPRYEEYKKPERRIEVPTIKRSMPGVITADRRHTPEMIDEAKTLLKLIQQDVTVYLDKLQEIEGQIGGTYPEMEKGKIHQEIKKSEIEKVDDVESQVDNLLSNLSKNKKIGE